MANANTDSPELNTVSIRLTQSNVEFTRFLAYEYHENFLTPADAWWFEVDAESLSQDDIAAIVPKAKVEISVAGLTQMVGYIDDVVTRSSASGGTVVHIDGRDWLSPAVDAQVDPRMKFTEGQTLADVVQQVLSPFGAASFTIDNEANRGILTGRIYGTPTSKKGKPLKSYVQHQLKPYPMESAFSFCSRISQRHGLWIWPGADGQSVIIGQPNFQQDPTYQIRHVLTDPTQNNVVESDVRITGSEQPSVILASGYGGGGVFAKSQLRCMAVNFFVTANLSAIFKAYPELQPINLPFPVGAPAFAFTDPTPRPLYLYDSEAHTQEQLEAFCRRELSLRTRKMIHAQYTIEGHRIGDVPVAVDTIVQVEDDRSIGILSTGPGIHTNLWTLSRRFSKRPSTGTMTTLELIAPYSLVF